MHTINVLQRTVIALRHSGPRWFFAAPGIIGLGLLGALTAGTGGAIHPVGRFIECLLMLLAMMGPFADEGLRHVQFRSIASRRNRACAIFLAGYGLACLITAVGFEFVVRALQMIAPDWPASAAAAVVLFAGAGWQGLASRTRVLATCHARPALAAFAWGADKDAAVYGLRLGLRCAACGAPLMLATMFEVGAVPLMILALAIACQERIGPRDRSREWRLLIIGAALVCAGWAVWGGVGPSVEDICRAGVRS